MTATRLSAPRPPATADPDRPMEATVYHHTHWDRPWEIPTVGLGFAS